MPKIMSMPKMEDLMMSMTKMMSIIWICNVCHGYLLSNIILSGACCYLQSLAHWTFLWSVGQTALMLLLRSAHVSVPMRFASGGAAAAASSRALACDEVTTVLLNPKITVFLVASCDARTSCLSVIRKMVRYVAWRLLVLMTRGCAVGFAADMSYFSKVVHCQFCWYWGIVAWCMVYRFWKVYRFPEDAVARNAYLKIPALCLHIVTSMPTSRRVLRWWMLYFAVRSMHQLHGFYRWQDVSEWVTTLQGRDAAWKS